MKRFLGIDPGLGVLLDKAPGEELDYGFVMECLKAYKNPRIKLNHLLKIEALIRVKKGIYIFGKNFARQPYSSEVLANSHPIRVGVGILLARLLRTNFLLLDSKYLL